eukprot:5084164-Pyramimonas_sp.AAC.1
MQGQAIARAEDRPGPLPAGSGWLAAAAAYPCQLNSFLARKLAFAAIQKRMSRIRGESETGAAQ